MSSAAGKQYYYGRQDLDDGDVAAALQALRADMISQGPILDEFEAEVASYTGAAHCLAVCNGTAALHLACLALGMGPGETGWTSPLSFVASANCIRFCSAEVGFVDIEPGTLNMDPALLEEKLAEADASGTCPRLLIPVHFAGVSCDMQAIRSIADRFGCRVIEDACQAMGGRYMGGPVGACTHSDITVFSLHPVKSITSGEGGLILTNDSELHAKMKLMRSHGLVKGDAVQDKNVGPWHVEVQSEGFNYRITESQCALGLSQLGKLDTFVAKRRELAARYRANLADVPVRLQEVPAGVDSAWHLMILLVDFDALGLGKQAFHASLKERGINVQVHYYPIHMQPLYRQVGFGEGMFPESERYHDQAFTFPLHTGLEVDDVDYICEQVRAILTRDNS